MQQGVIYVKLKPITISFITREILRTKNLTGLLFSTLNVIEIQSTRLLFYFCLFIFIVIADKYVNL